MGITKIDGRLSPTNCRALSAVQAGRVLPASGGSIGLDFFPPVGGHGDKFFINEKLRRGWLLILPELLSSLEVNA